MFVCRKKKTFMDVKVLSVLPILRKHMNFDYDIEIKRIKDNLLKIFTIEKSQNTGVHLRREVILNGWVKTKKNEEEVASILSKIKFDIWNKSFENSYAFIIPGEDKKDLNKTIIEINKS